MQCVFPIFPLNIFLAIDSIIGALSIIGSVIIKKQVTSPKVLVINGMFPQHNIA